MMEYKGYIGKVEIDEEVGILYGKVINVRDVKIGRASCRERV